MRKKQIDLFGAISWTMFPGLMANQSIGPRRLPFRPIWTRDEETDSQYLFKKNCISIISLHIMITGSRTYFPCPIWTGSFKII